MNAADSHLFSLLKQAVARVFLEKNHAPKNISDWKGEDIIAFQEDLFAKTNGRVSEKWFYTYFKNKPTKLPRIDMLNLLCTYSEEQNWHAFQAKHAESQKTLPKNRRRAQWLIFSGLLIILFTMYFLRKKNNTFQFCMIDEDRKEAITQIPIDIKILQKNLSPIYIKTDSLGCFTYVSSEEIIHFVIQSPYHKTDTIIRHINGNANSVIPVRTDDYALMLQYYSNGNTGEVQKRQTQLQQLIAADAEIYQLFPQHSGVELYSKDDFIAKLLIPTSSLKHIKILDKRYTNGKITKLKFIIQ